MLIDTQLQSAVSTTLEPDEKLLWVGRPDPLRFLLQVQNLIIFVFGAVWTSHAISFITKWTNPDFFFYIFMTPFVIIGIVMMLTPVWNYWEGRRTIYAITDKRVLILVVGKSLKFDSYSDIDANVLQRTERANGTGDLTVAKKQTKDNDGDVRTIDVKFWVFPMCAPSKER